VVELWQEIALRLGRMLGSTGASTKFMQAVQNLEALSNGLRAWAQAFVRERFPRCKLKDFGGRVKRAQCCRRVFTLASGGNDDELDAAQLVGLRCLGAQLAYGGGDCRVRPLRGDQIEAFCGDVRLNLCERV
jgi:hypothetical protein